MAMRIQHIGKPLLIGMVVCYACGLFPYYSKQTDPDTSEQVTQASLGFPFSPWFAYRHVQSADGASFHYDSGIRFLSWSWIPLILGTVLLKVWKRLPPASQPSSPE